MIPGDKDRHSLRQYLEDHKAWLLGATFEDIQKRGAVSGVYVDPALGIVANAVTILIEEYRASLTTWPDDAEMRETGLEFIESL